MRGTEARASGPFIAADRPFAASVPHRPGPSHPGWRTCGVSAAPGGPDAGGPLRSGQSRRRVAPRLLPNLHRAAPGPSTRRHRAPHTRRQVCPGPGNPAPSPRCSESWSLGLDCHLIFPAVTFPSGPEGPDPARMPPPPRPISPKRFAAGDGAGRQRGEGNGQVTAPRSGETTTAGL